MNHKTIIQWTIVGIVGIVVFWSIANVTAYAYLFHASWTVVSLGIAVGAANAVSVYAYVIAHSQEERTPALWGIILFGGASGILQTLLYVHESAPLLAAFAFGWIGPVAEGILSWLHAALAEGAAQPARKRTAKPQPAKPATALQENAATATAEVQPAIALTANMIEAYNMQKNGMSRKEIAEAKQVSLRTVDNWTAKAKAAMNGGSHD